MAGLPGSLEKDIMKRLIHLRRLHLPRFAFVMLLWSAFALAQKAEYDFYPGFRNSFAPSLRAENSSVTDEQILQRYEAQLRSEGIAESEIARRTRLIRTNRDVLEDDYWNRFYTDTHSNFNTAPNSFLVKVVEGRSAGVALDYAMGEGRNAIYLAKLAEIGEQKGTVVWNDSCYSFIVIWELKRSPLSRPQMIIQGASSAE
jgi:hypothetical protein